MLRFLGGEPWGWFGLLGLREEGTGRLDSGPSVCLCMGDVEVKGTQKVLSCSA